MDDQIQHILQSNNVEISSPTKESASDDQIQGVLKKNGVEITPAASSSQGGFTGNYTLGDQSDNGMCQRFVEKQLTGRTGIYPSASAAYQDQAQKGNINSDFSQMQPGDALYFADPNQPDGHVGIVDGPDSMVSATYNGVQKSNISDWLAKTGQRPLGFIRGYK